MMADVGHRNEMIRQVTTLTIVAMLYAPFVTAKDIESVRPDLVTPTSTGHEPTPGKRVRQTNKNYAGTEVHHLLYLPTDWVKGKKYPVIVEYAGNKWKTSPGTVEGSNLGYGISGGKGVIWICMPFVDEEHYRNAATWWGDVDATVEYCRETVDRICEEYGGDRSNIFIAGFSRGAIACNFIGLHDDEIALLWRGFICHSQYDGVKKWGYAGSDRTSAATRLKRLGNRPQFISHEHSVEPTRKYLENAFPSGNFTFLAMSFPNHTDSWVLRDIPERKVIRNWFNKVLKEKNQQGSKGNALNRAP
jgi:hypothetical protein